MCTRTSARARAHYVDGVNTTTRGMWFVQLLDDLGKAMGLPNGTRDMNVENYGKLILKESDTTVGIFNPFGFREDYGGQDMIPIDYQVEVRNNWPDHTLMLGGGLTPNQGLSQTLERLHEYVETVQGLRPQALHLRLHDQAEGLVVRRREAGLSDLGECRKLGIKNIGCHKGMPFGQF